MLWLFYVDHIFSHTTISRLCTKPASYWPNYISVITFCKYENNKKQSQNPDILGNLEVQAGEKEDVWWPCYISIIQYDGEHGRLSH